MARYTGPATRKSRRLGVDLVGDDQSFEKRPYPPGQHGRARIKESEYRTQLQEKQKARFTYGVMEKQFRRYYEEANRQSGKTGENLLRILESRLDNVVYRAGLARTRHRLLLLRGETKREVFLRALQGDDVRELPIRAALGIGLEPVRVHWCE